MPVAFKKCNNCKEAKPQHLFKFGGFICDSCREEVSKKDMEKKDGSKEHTDRG